MLNKNYPGNEFFINVPFIACVINVPGTFTQYLDFLEVLVLIYGLSYFTILTICLLLVYFVSAAGCHCFHYYVDQPLVFLNEILISAVKFFDKPQCYIAL